MAQLKSINHWTFCQPPSLSTATYILTYFLSWKTAINHLAGFAAVLILICNMAQTHALEDFQDFCCTTERRESCSRLHWHDSAMISQLTRLPKDFLFLMGSEQCQEFIHFELRFSRPVTGVFPLRLPLPRVVQKKRPDIHTNMLPTYRLSLIYELPQGPSLENDRKKNVKKIGWFFMMLVYSYTYMQAIKVTLKWKTWASINVPLIKPPISDYIFIIGGL